MIKNKGLNLNIFGSSGSGQFGVIPLRVQADNGSYLPHETTWDVSLYGPDLVNSAGPNKLNINLNDYSVNQYDYLYGINNGKNCINYNLQSSWYADMIDIKDDIALVGVKDWTSTEKYTINHLGSNAFVSCDNVYPVTMISTVPAFVPSCTTTSWTINYDAHGKPEVGNGTLTITYVDCQNESRTISYWIPHNDDRMEITLDSKTEPTYTWVGGDDPVSTIISNGSVTYPGTIGCPYNTYQVQDNIMGIPYCYFNEFEPLDGLSKTISYINVKNIEYLFQKTQYQSNYPADNNYLDNYNLQSNSPVGIYWKDGQEFPDYSDVFLKINYSRGAALSDTIAVLSSDTKDYIYTFGGFISVSEYISKCENLTRANLPFSTNNALQDTEGYKWYIVYRETAGDYLFVTLSSYVIPSVINSNADLTTSLGGIPLGYAERVAVGPQVATKIFNSSSDDGSYLNPQAPGIFTIINNNILIDSIDIIKIVNYPSCGKLDIYTRKGGMITAASGNTITSSGHNLSTGDQIKITCGLPIVGSGTDVNGFRYVSGVDANKFKIYFDSGFTAPISTSGLRTVSGVQWTAIGGSAWKYQHTLYSPNGKNGYGFVPQLRTIVETGVGQTMLDRAIETDPIEYPTGPGIINVKPQSYLNSWISWNNFYPFQRIGTDPNALDYTDNGNRFGSDCRVQKLNDNEYIFAVSEPGAEVSFRIFEDYIIKSQTNKNPQVKIVIPNNKFILPAFLPYGRVHFYKITKNPYSVEYLNSTKIDNNPWTSYETSNAANKYNGNVNYYADIGNYPIDVTKVKNIYNNTVDNYWIGARYYSWNKNYTFDPTYGIEMPDQSTYINEYAFLDSFGKSLVFNIVGSSIYCAASTNVKSAGFTNNTRMKYIDALSKTFKYNLQTNSFSNFSGIINQSNYTTSRAQEQVSELENYGNSLDYYNGKLGIGWPAAYRGQESIYIYQTSGINYNLSQTITTVGNNKFGNYFAMDDNFIIADSISSIDDSGNITFPLSYLNIYQLDQRINQYYYSHRLSPTIDIGNYNGLNQIQYTPTQNISYDNTTDSSVTYNIDLYGKYDISNNAIIMRDYYEYSFFTYDGLSNKFKCRSHHKILNDSNSSDLGIIRMQPSNYSFTGSSDGEFISSFDVLDGFDNVYNTRVISTSYQNRKFLPLMIKVIEGEVHSGINLFTRGKDSFSSGINLYTQGPLPYATGFNLFAKQPDVYQSGLNLFMKEYDLSSQGINLAIRSQNAESGMTLVINPRFNGYFPLVMQTYTNYKLDENGSVIETNDTPTTITTQDNFESLSLYMDNHHTGVPNASGSFYLSLKTRPYDDYGQGMNITMNYPFPKSSESLDLIVNNPSGSSFSDMKLVMLGSDILYGIESSGSMNLYIHRIMEATMPLTVYNTYSSGGLDLYTRGAYLGNSGINLYTSGEVYPTESNTSLPIYVRGTKL